MGAALIVDNDKETLLTLSEIFRGEGFTTEVSESLTDARGALMRKMPDVAVIRESLAGGDSLRLIEELDLSRVRHRSWNPSLRIELPSTDTSVH